MRWLVFYKRIPYGPFDTFQMAHEWAEKLRFGEFEIQALFPPTNHIWVPTDDRHPFMTQYGCVVCNTKCAVPDQEPPYSDTPCELPQA